MRLRCKLWGSKRKAFDFRLIVTRYDFAACSGVLLLQYKNKGAQSELMLSSNALRLLAAALVLYFVVFIVRFELHASSLSSGKQHDPQHLFQNQLSGQAARSKHQKKVGSGLGAHVEHAPSTKHPSQRSGAAGDGKARKGREAAVVPKAPTKVPAATTAVPGHHHRVKKPLGAEAMTAAPTNAPHSHAPHHRHRNVVTAAPSTAAPKHAAEHRVPRAPHNFHNKKRGIEKDFLVVDRVAYAVVISNEDFVDGALVLGVSFWNHSQLVRSGNATLVAIVPEKAVGAESIRRLRLAGWAHVYQVHDLTQYVPKNAHYAATFNKLYLFNLTQYHRVATFDVDMLMLQSPDTVFRTHLESPSWIGALGNSHRKNHSYFQTGMMLIIPTTETFTALMHEFHSNPHQRDMNGRDGRLIRQYFQDRYVNLDSSLSAHLGVHEPLKNVIGFHFRGEFKPWFNKEFPPTKPAYGVKSDKPMEQELGEAYRQWWATYEHLHETKLAPQDIVSPSHDTPKHYDAKSSMWLMRHTARSYVQLRRQDDEAVRNKTYTGLVLELSVAGASCDTTCAERQSVCKTDALSFTMIDSCETLQKAFGCQECTMNYPGSDEPSYDQSSRVCYVNSLDYKNQRPLCNATMNGHRRLCSCLPLERAYEAATTVSEPFVIARDNTTEVRSEEPFDAHKESGCHPSRSESFVSDVSCRMYLQQVDNIEWVSVLGRTPLVGRTVKLLAHYKEAGVKAVIKFPQKLFPHEAHSEVAAYSVDRALNLGRVPPTVFTFIPLNAVRDAVVNATKRNSDQVLLTSLTSLHDELLAYLEHQAGALTRKTSTGSIEVGVSIQLWMNDVHRIADSIFGAAASAQGVHKLFSQLLAGGKNVKLDESISELGRLIAFDFVIGNDDRTPTKNSFAIGGCVRYCSYSTPFAYSGTPHLLYIDQGRSFYYSGNPEDNPLSGKHADHYCSFPKRLIQTLLDASHNRTTLGTLTRKGTARVDGEDDSPELRSTLEKKVLATLLPSVLKIITEDAINHAQNRLERFLDHVDRCLAKHPASIVMIA